MRRITGAAFISLDGIVQGPGGPTEDPTGGFEHGGWVFGTFDAVIGSVMDDVFTSPYDLLLGRRTYEIFAAFWPYAQGNQAAMGEALTEATKHVVSRGDTPLDWANSRRLAGIEAVTALKATDGPDLLIQGSSTLYPPLLAAGLIDRLILMIYPVVLGGGKRLFGDGTAPGALRLVDHRVGDAGVIVARYEPAGAVRTGTPPDLHEPSAAEGERRRRMVEGTW